MPSATDPWLQRRLKRAIEEMARGRLFRARSMLDEMRERYAEDPNVLRLAGDISRLEGELEHALEHYILAVRQDPSHLPTLDRVTQLATVLDQMERAVQAIEVSVVADPQDPKRHLRLADAYFRAGRVDDALGHAQLAVSLDPTDPAAYDLLGVVLVHLDELVAAVEAERRAISLDPGRSTARVSLGVALEGLGEHAEAKEHLSHALELAPDDPIAAFHTKDLVEAGADGGRLLALEERIADPELDNDARVMGGLALAKLWDDRGDVARAAQHLIEANEARAVHLRRRGRDYDQDRERRTIQAIRYSFGSGLYERFPRGEQQGPLPIVLIGLPRAGKSLLEAGLCRADDVGALGERPLATRLLTRLAELTGRTEFPAVVEGLDARKLEELRSWSSEQLQGNDGSAAAKVLTAGNNVMLAGLVALCHPRTVIVHCDRDPRDLLLANYLQWFPSGQSFAWRPIDLVHRTVLVAEYVAHWRRVRGSQVLRVTYESLVEEPESLVGLIRRHAGLPVVDLVMPRHDGIAPVASPTAKPDPTQPLHRQHIGMWQKWWPHLPELANAIEQTKLVERYDQPV